MGSSPALAFMFQRNKMFLLRSLAKIKYCGEPPRPTGSSSTSHRQGSNFETCVWRTESSHASHHFQKVFLAQFSPYVHKGRLKHPFSNSICLIFSTSHLPYLFLFLSVEAPCWIFCNFLLLFEKPFDRAVPAIGCWGGGGGLNIK